MADITLGTIGELTNLIDEVEQCNITDTNNVGRCRRQIKKMNGELDLFLNDNTIIPNIATLTKETNVIIAIAAGNTPDPEFIVDRVSSEQRDAVGAQKSITLSTEANVGVVFSDSAGNLTANGIGLELPERGVIEQLVWEARDNSATPEPVFVIVTDVGDSRDSGSNVESSAIAKIFGAQPAQTLNNAPDSACEVIDMTSVSVGSWLNGIDRLNRRTLLTKVTGLQTPGLTSRQLRDMTQAEMVADPALKHPKATLTNDGDGSTAAVTAGELARTTLFNDIVAAADDAARLVVAKAAGLWSASLGPHPNGSYSDYKRFKFANEIAGPVTLTFSMPVIAWGTGAGTISGIKKRVSTDANIKTNRKDDGRQYIIDMGGKDRAIRDHFPNPLPPHRFDDNGPQFTDDVQGAIRRYKGGKCLGINTTDTDTTITTNLITKKGETIVLTELPVKGMTAQWKLDKGSFSFSDIRADGTKGGKAGYYTVFAASRPPPAGFMGVPQVPRHHRFGRGKPVISSGATAAHGRSQLDVASIDPTGLKFLRLGPFPADAAPVLCGIPEFSKPDYFGFVKQDTTGALDAAGATVALDKNAEAAGLTGTTSAFNGHGLLWEDYKAFKDTLPVGTLVKGVDYLTLPADEADVGGVRDLLIPVGKTIPRINNAVATLYQFGNGKKIPDGGPNTFQAGLVPFLGSATGYTPQWHINFQFFNSLGGTNSLGGLEGRDFIAGGLNEVVEDSAQGFKRGIDANWANIGKNPSNSGPPPCGDNSENSQFSMMFPNSFDPVQMRCEERRMARTNFLPDAVGNPIGTIMRLGDSAGGVNGASSARPGALNALERDSSCIKGANCVDFINRHGGILGEIGFSQQRELEETNKMFITEAPGGALQGWNKFLIVNCPLPVTIDFEVRQEGIVATPGGGGGGGGSTATDGNVTGGVVDNILSCHAAGAAAVNATCGTQTTAWFATINGASTAIGTTDTVKLQQGDTFEITNTTPVLGSVVHGVVIHIENNTAILGTHKWTTPRGTALATDNVITTAEVPSVRAAHEAAILTYDTTGTNAPVDASLASVVSGFSSFGQTETAGLPFQQRGSGASLVKFTVQSAATIGTKGSIICSVHGTSMRANFEIVAAC